LVQTAGGPWREASAEESGVVLQRLYGSKQSPHDRMRHLAEVLAAAARASGASAVLIAVAESDAPDARFATCLGSTPQIAHLTDYAAEVVANLPEQNEGKTS
jgi:hypothetical protein